MKARKFLILTSIVLFLSSCGKSSFNSAGGDKPTPTPTPITITESFQFKGKPPIGDFLFILDNSSSMETKIAKVQQSLRDIPLSRYPDNSRLAVMSTMVSKYDNFNLTHDGIFKYAGIEFEPGFLSFVNRTQIVNFLAKPNVPQKFKDRYPILGCQSTWFTPGQKDASGKRCFEAALQSALHGVGCEAGLNAFEQLLEKNKNSPLFRKDSYVHIIHVSDEKHPGCDNAELLSKVPSYDKLKNAVIANSAASGFKVHGIGVDDLSSTASPSNYPVSVRKRAEESNGIYLSIHENNYNNIIESILSSGKFDKATFALRSQPTKVLEVKIDDVVTSDYIMTTSGNLEILKIDTEKDHKISIVYEMMK